MKKIVIHLLYFVLAIIAYIIIKIIIEKYERYGFTHPSIENTSITKIKEDFTFDEILFFTEVGLQDEANTINVVKKFSDEKITYKVFGTPTLDQLRFFNKSIKDLNSVLKYNKIVQYDNNDSICNLRFYFITEDEMKNYNPKMYWSAAFGYIHVNKIQKCVLKNVDVFIMIDKKDENGIKGVILQELTQSLGIFEDSERINNTIFKDGFFLDSIYGPMDLACVKILYNYGLKPGTKIEDFESALNLTYDSIYMRTPKKIYNIFNQDRKIHNSR